jgi:hypothetical protein
MSEYLVGVLSHLVCTVFCEGEWWMFYFGGSAETIEFGARGAGAGKALQGFRMLPGLIKSTGGFVFNRKHSPGSPLLQIGRKNEFDEVFIAWPRVIPPPCKELEGQFLPMNKEHWLMTYSSIQQTSPPVSAIGAATRDGPTGQAAFEISLSLSKIDFKKHHANLRSCLLLICRPRSVDASTQRHGESEQQAKNRRMAGRMKCPSG